MDTIGGLGGYLPFEVIGEGRQEHEPNHVAIESEEEGVDSRSEGHFAQRLERGGQELHEYEYYERHDGLLRPVLRFFMSLSELHGCGAGHG